MNANPFREVRHRRRIRLIPFCLFSRILSNSLNSLSQQKRDSQEGRRKNACSGKNALSNLGHRGKKRMEACGNDGDLWKSIEADFSIVL